MRFFLTCLLTCCVTLCNLEFATCVASGFNTVGGGKPLGTRFGCSDCLQRSLGQTQDRLFPDTLVDEGSLYGELCFPALACNSRVCLTCGVLCSGLTCLFCFAMNVYNDDVNWERAG